MTRLTIASFLFVTLLATTPVHPAIAVDHSAYDSLLEKHVVGGYFDYEAFVNNPGDLKKLQQYRGRMSQIQPDELSRDEALAYWINLYNASTIHLIAENYPVKSIRDLGGWVTSVFDRQFIPTQRGKISLNTLEHEIIRPKFEEPRIHFALVCAARSCPPLRNEAYTADNLESQLEDQTRQFLESDKNRFTLTDGTLTMQLSSIFYWYSEDFGGEDGIASYVADYRPSNQAEAIERGRYELDYLDYDWSLNQAPGPYGRNG